MDDEDWVNTCGEWSFRSCVWCGSTWRERWPDLLDDYALGVEWWAAPLDDQAWCLECRLSPPEHYTCTDCGAQVNACPLPGDAYPLCEACATGWYRWSLRHYLDDDFDRWHPADQPLNVPGSVFAPDPVPYWFAYRGSYHYNLDVIVRLTWGSADHEPAPKPGMTNCDWCGATTVDEPAEGEDYPLCDNCADEHRALVYGR